MEKSEKLSLWLPMITVFIIFFRDLFVKTFSWIGEIIWIYIPKHLNLFVDIVLYILAFIFIIAQIFFIKTVLTTKVLKKQRILKVFLLLPYILYIILAIITYLNNPNIINYIREYSFIISPLLPISILVSLGIIIYITNKKE